jgi:threonine synthase
MDIQVSSNFERLLFEVTDRDPARVCRLMGDLTTSGRFVVPEPALAKVREDFAAGRADESETRETIRATYEATGFLADPHTAVGLAVASRFARDGVPMISLATAHPAKFGAVVKAAVGFEPLLPPQLAGVMDKPERVTTLDNDTRAVEAFISARARASLEKV